MPSLIYEDRLQAWKTATIQKSIMLVEAQDKRENDFKAALRFEVNNNIAAKVARLLALYNSGFFQMFYGVKTVETKQTCQQVKP